MPNGRSSSIENSGGGRTSHLQAQAYSNSPARFRLLSSIWQEFDVGHARFSTENIPGRLKHRGSPKATVAAGIEVSEIFHLGPNGPVGGPDPEHGTYRSLATFSDPDGNSWLLQEITTRLPGRIDSGVTSFGSVTDLVGALRRAEAAHGEHEKRTGVRDANWADWYAAYMAAEQIGAALPT